MMYVLNANNVRKIVEATAIWYCQSRLFSRCIATENKFVNRIKTLQSLKNDISDVHYKTGKYMMFSERGVLLSRNEPLHTILWGSYKDVAECAADITKQSVLLSVFEGNNVHFAVRVLPELKQRLEHSFGRKFTDLRTSLFTLSSADSALVSQGWSLLSWGDLVQFCEACGGRLETAAAGTQKKCSACGVVRYPALSPVGITLLTNEDRSRALLVRQHIHPPGMFTCIAGFIEVGESVEENVKREVAEEVGLEAREVEYVGSQHWALPASRLMIGCIAVVTEAEFSLDKTELEAAAWCTPQQVHDALTRVTDRGSSLLNEPGHMWVPPRGAIAHDLMWHWLRTSHTP